MVLISIQQSGFLYNYFRGGGGGGAPNEVDEFLCLLLFFSVTGGGGGNSFSSFDNFLALQNESLSFGGGGGNFCPSPANAEAAWCLGGGGGGIGDILCCPSFSLTFFALAFVFHSTHVSLELLIGGGIGGGISEFMVARTCSLSATGEGDSVKLLFLRDFLLNLCPFFFTLKILMLFFVDLIIAIAADGGGGGGGAFGLDSWAFCIFFLRS